MKDRELKDRGIRIKKEIKRKELFFKAINMSIIDMNKFEEKEMMKKRPHAWYDILTNYISGSVKYGGGVKDKIMHLFKTNAIEEYSKPKRARKVYGGRKKSRKPKVKKI